MSRRRDEDEDELGDLGRGDEEGERVQRPLSAEQVAEREQQLAQGFVELLDLKEKHLDRAAKSRAKIKDAQTRLQQLAMEIKERAEWVPAQLALADAAKSRARTKRGTQAPGAESGI